MTPLVLNYMRGSSISRQSGTNLQRQTTSDSCVLLTLCFLLLSCATILVPDWADECNCMHQLLSLCIVFLVVTDIGPVEMNAGTTYVTIDNIVRERYFHVSMQLLWQS